MIIQFNDFSNVYFSTFLLLTNFITIKYKKTKNNNY